LSTWKPSAKTRAAGAPVDVDISKLQTGQLVRVLWRKKPVWIFKRGAEALAALESDAVIKNLSDPDGSGYSKNQQPKYVTTSYRSIKNKEEVAVIVAVCTHLGCSPTYRPEPGAADLGGENWKGGFYCPCKGSKFDLAGRVYAGVPAPTNLVIPPYHYVSDTLIRIGVDPEIS
jgi:ubiquinol-cytochrome c reductase iron-sulfur subunit